MYVDAISMELANAIITPNRRQPDAEKPSGHVFSVSPAVAFKMAFTGSTFSSPNNAAGLLMSTTPPMVTKVTTARKRPRSSPSNSQARIAT